MFSISMMQLKWLCYRYRY